MGFTYLDNQNWGDISREERLYCAFLFEAGRKNPSKLLDLIGPKIKLENAERNLDWELGYEVCFYRDYFYNIRKMPVRSSGYSPKRTFDLALFSEKRIIILETKVHQPFNTEQINIFKRDKEWIKKLFGKQFGVNLVAVCSSEYRSKLLNNFDAIITWKELSMNYRNSIFNHANAIYHNGLNRRRNG